MAHVMTRWYSPAGGSYCNNALNVFRGNETQFGEFPWVQKGPRALD